MIAQLENENRHFDDLIQEQKEKMAKEAEPKKKHDQEMKSAMKRITKEHLARCFKYLEKKGNQSVTYVLEAVVGLLRGQKLADNYSVELYMKKHESLILALARADPQTMNRKDAEEHLAVLAQHTQELESDEQLVDFAPFALILKSMCLLTFIASNEKKVDVIIQRHSESKNAKLKQIEEKKAILSNLTYNTELQNEITFYKEQKLTHFKEKEAYMQKRITEITAQLDNFEAKFFEGI